jgi:hypothetical protein
MPCGYSYDQGVTICSQGGADAWGQVAKLIADDGADLTFGISVAIPAIRS